MMQRLLILTFLVLFSSCGEKEKVKENVFSFEGSVNRQFVWEDGDISDWLGDYNMSADYSIQFTIMDEEIHYIVSLKNRKYSRKDKQNEDVFLNFLKSKCYDEHGNVLFGFKDIVRTEQSDGIEKGILPNVTAERVRKVAKINVILEYVDDARRRNLEKGIFKIQ